MILIILLVQHRKKNSINCTKASTKFALSLHYNNDEIYLHVNIKNWKFKVHDNIPWYEFSLWSVSKKFTKDKWMKFH